MASPLGRDLVGLDALEAGTRLLQRIRAAHPTFGLYEAADLQWWWRTPRRSDAVEQLFWVADEAPFAALVLTEWARAWGCDPIGVPGTDVSPSRVWTRALERIEELGLERVETLVRDDDPELRALVTAAGFTADERSGITWMDAQDRPEPAPVHDGFVLVDRATAAERPHPLRRRNGDQVEERLRQCSLYDPALDLTVEAQDGDVAGYALFWFDPVTHVGLVEPMRVEDAYQRRGLGRALLTEGLDRLARRGARRFKVGYATEPARALYTGAGFRVAVTATSYIWSRP